MKDARWRDFLQRGFFPAVAQHRLCFKRLTACQALVDVASYDLLVMKVLSGRRGVWHCTLLLVLCMTYDIATLCSPQMSSCALMPMAHLFSQRPWNS